MSRRCGPRHAPASPGGLERHGFRPYVSGWKRVPLNARRYGSLVNTVVRRSTREVRSWRADQGVIRPSGRRGSSGGLLALVKTGLARLNAVPRRPVEILLNLLRRREFGTSTKSRRLLYQAHHPATSSTVANDTSDSWRPASCSRHDRAALEECGDRQVRVASRAARRMIEDGNVATASRGCRRVRRVACLVRNDVRSRSERSCSSPPSSDSDGLYLDRSTPTSSSHGDRPVDDGGNGGMCRREATAPLFQAEESPSNGGHRSRRPCTAWRYGCPRRERHEVLIRSGRRLGDFSHSRIFPLCVPLDPSECR